MSIRIPILLVATILGVTILGCEKSQPTRGVFFLGHRSDPDVSAIREGAVLDTAAGESLAVFGLGELSGEPWGTVTISWDDEGQATFTKGGVVSWAPEESTRFSAKGRAEVPLVAFLLEGVVDGSLKPSSLTVRRVWQIKQGEFTINGKITGQQVSDVNPH